MCILPEVGTPSASAWWSPSIMHYPRINQMVKEGVGEEKIWRKKLIEEGHLIKILVFLNLAFHSVSFLNPPLLRCKPRKPIFSSAATYTIWIELKLENVVHNLHNNPYNKSWDPEQNNFPPPRFTTLQFRCILCLLYVQCVLSGHSATHRDTLSSGYNSLFKSFVRHPSQPPRFSCFSRSATGADGRGGGEGARFNQRKGGGGRDPQLHFCFSWRTG